MAGALPVLVAVFTIITFLPALKNGFVDWDDRENFLENPHYRGLAPSHLLWMFTTFLKGPYQPLSWMTLGLDYILWGMNPFGYHLTNIVLHASTAAVFYFVALRLIVLARGAAMGVADLSARLGAAFAALLFAIHPLRVESVAWVTERRDVLSGLLVALTLLMYLRTAAPRSAERIPSRAPAVVLYALSLLAKAIGMSLPLVLIVLDVYPLRRLPADPRLWWSGDARKTLTEKVPFVVLAVIAALVALLGQSQVEALEGAREYGLAARLGVPVYALAFYLVKTVLPFGLSPLYALPDRPAALTAWFALSGAGVLAFGYMLWRMRRKAPSVLAAAAAFACLLLPVLGVLQFGGHLAADRYTYLPAMAWAVLAGGALAWGSSRNADGPARIAAAPVLGAALVLTTLSAITWTQAQVWHDSETLWRHAERHDPGAPMIHNYLGLALMASGKPDAAIAQYEEAIRLRPSYPEAHVNWGVALSVQGDYTSAIEQYRRATEISKVSAEAHHNWGIALMLSGSPEEAISHLEESLRLDPRLPGSRSMLASLYLDRGRTAEALSQAAEIVGYEPPEGELPDRLAWMLEGEDFATATRLLEESVRRYPEAESPKLGLALARIRRDRLSEAAALYVEVLSRNPDCLRAYQNLSNLCLQAGLCGAAREIAHTGLSLTPSDTILLHNAERAEQALRERAAEIGRWMAMRGTGTAPPDVLLRIAAADIDEGRREDARKASSEALAARPGFPEATWLQLIAEGRAMDPHALLARTRMRELS